ncbi:MULTISPECIES: diguanylate cyclase domain-containing protein [unclassified Photobacterium]|uniref:diguanylate cyclase domain-containing protein n=1 Tax=unclassified Photobacterium TaxID=2628852 RepID=UPI000D15A372|nr:MULTISPECIES: diguanylate cyclase [unclassified Photobacterium]PSV35440.1 sensor domain-containing diguanylate cyclase [Photobacterium sp. GB-27]PSV51690.1 sensor domain-containing diguanylate cyclase [Photobacterium sp. GB-1]
MRNNWMNSLSLNQRLYLPLVFFVVVLFIVFQTLSSYKYIESEKQNLVNRITILSTGIGTNLTAAIQFDDATTGQEILSAFSADPMIVSVSVLTANDVVFAGFNNTDNRHLPANEAEEVIVKAQGHVFSKQYLYMQIPIYIENTELAKMRIVVSLDRLHALKSSQIEISLYLLVILILFSSFVIRRLRHWMISPIRQLNDAMINVIHFNQTEVVQHPTSSKDELSELIDCFNTMIIKLNQRELKIKQTISQLEYEKEFADDVISTVQHALLVVDHSGHIILANDSSSKLFHDSPQVLQSQHICDVIKPVDLEKFQDQLDQTLQGNKQFSHDLVKTVGIKGTAIYQVVSHPLQHKNQTLFALEDVTERSVAERQQQLAAKIFENSREAILLLNGQGYIEMVNLAFCELIGQEHGTIIGKYYRSVLIETETLLMRKEILMSLSLDQQWQGECSFFNRKRGVTTSLHLKINQLIDTESNESQIVVLASDISSVKEAQRLAYIAQHDALTHLPNREFLHHYLVEALTLPRSDVMAVLFIDLDGFKFVNDSYGHDIGDKVLQIVAKKLMMSVRQNDIVTRLAGDEFVAVLNPVNSREPILNIGERIINNISQSINIKGYSINIGASIGCYYIEPQDVTGIDSVLHCADMAMYQSKMQGKGRITEFNQLNIDTLAE